MKTKIIFSAAAIITLFCTHTFSFAQGCHGGGGGNMSSMNNTTTVSDNPNKNAMYGGTVKKVGKYTIEMVYQPLLANDPLTFLLMNKKGKPISNKGITGKAEITYPDKSTGTITLEPLGENGFAGQMQNKTGSFICFLTLQINGENITARFDGDAVGKENATAAAGYTCPMHPEVQSDNPGNCPKCGMALVKKSNTSGKQEMKMMCPMMGGMSDMNKMESKEKDNATNQNKTDSNTGAQDTIIYTCPMHAEVKAAQPGNCPKCGMTLEKKTVKKSDVKTEKKETAKTYTCPMHAEVKSDKPGSCPKCGMNLVEKKNK
ncbi:MAG: hypothetical protein HY841_00515 [Bacteroidetes bacterium]|nr:hypothetical protein [Bacteroidota bacterium]